MNTINPHPDVAEPAWPAHDGQEVVQFDAFHRCASSTCRIDQLSGNISCYSGSGGRE